MNTLDNQYHTLLKRILEYGVTKGDRTGTGTLSVFGGQFTHDMSEGFPLLTTKKMAVKTMMTELKWFLKGDTNIKYLVDNGCNIWNGDAYKNYRNKFEPSPYQFTPDTMEEFINKIKTDDEFAEEWGGLGPIYGKQWRDWTEYYVEKFNGGNPIIVERTKDQIENLIAELKENPDSRRLMVNAWNVSELSDMVLPPCHYGFQCYTTEMSFKERIEHWTSSIGKSPSYGKRFDETDLDERNVPKRKLSLMWSQRSVDTFLGLPFNIASYGLLLSLLSKEVNMVPDQLVGSLGDVHIYNNHMEQVKEQLRRDSYELPTIDLDCMDCEFDILDGMFGLQLTGYKHHPSIKGKLSN
jgi:thymidylate synthase